jgi:hypothetical protein
MRDGKAYAFNQGRELVARLSRAKLSAEVDHSEEGNARMSRHRWNCLTRSIIDGRSGILVGPVPIVAEAVADHRQRPSASLPNNRQ